MPQQMRRNHWRMLLPRKALNPTLDLEPALSRPQPFNLIVSGHHVWVCACMFLRKKEETVKSFIFPYIHLISGIWVAKFHRYLTMH